MTRRLVDAVVGTSFLEDAFVRWVLAAAATPEIASHISPQAPVTLNGRTYRLDFLLVGARSQIVVELDGFEFHRSRDAFVFDRIRQNDLVGAGYQVLRFTYGSIRDHTVSCVAQMQALLLNDPLLAATVIEDPLVPVPHDMTASMLSLVDRPDQQALSNNYFDIARQRLDLRPLRDCQREALAALSTYYRRGGTNAATVLSVGAGKTALGVVAALAFSRRRTLIVTPGRVIRGTFATALDPASPRNVLYALGGGPILAGQRPPTTLVVDGGEGPGRSIGSDRLLGADIIVTNFHGLHDVSGNGLLSQLRPDDVDFIVVDEAHIAAADSYQRLFAHFPAARRLQMSACFARGDGRAIDADVVYRYRLLDSMADGHAKHLRVHRFSPEVSATAYEIVWPEGRREIIVGKDALLGILSDERKLARITATSEEPIQRVMAIVRRWLDEQRSELKPVRPRVLFAALGQAHAAQVARIANAYGIASETLHYTMSDSEITATCARFESDSGTLDAIVQLRMLGQGYDLPAIALIVPMRPYGSFGDFYQFLGRGIRTIQHPSLAGARQHVDLIYHGELGLDQHLETLRLENDMDPRPTQPDEFGDPPGTEQDHSDHDTNIESLRVAVLDESGDSRQQVLHQPERVEARREERELAVLAQRYAVYAASTSNPRSFAEFIAVIRSIHG